MVFVAASVTHAGRLGSRDLVRMVGGTRGGSELYEAGVAGCWVWAKGVGRWKGAMVCWGGSSRVGSLVHGEGHVRADHCVCLRVGAREPPCDLCQTRTGVE
jgi:hypothetical protein